MYKKYKVLSIIITVCMLIGTLATTAWAQDNDVLIEVEALREENIKHYLLPDGSYKAIVYNNAVHRKDANGEWQDIDNTLNDVNNKQAYITADGRTAFSKKVSQSDATIFQLNENGYSIEVSFQNSNIKNVNAKLSNHAKKYVPNSTDSLETQYKKLKAIDNNTTIKYKNILKCIDLEYVLSANDIKENIVINDKYDQYEYVFNYKLDGLVAVLNADGSIDLCDAIDNSIVYSIPKPFMFDANGEISYDVEYVLNELEAGSYELIIIADDAWINNDSRTFPVTIDPTMQFYAGAFDTYIDANNPNSNYAWISNMPLSTTQTIYLHPGTLPSIPDNATISSATLNAYYFFNSNSGNANIGVYLVGMEWDENTLTWNIANQYSNGLYELGYVDISMANATATASSNITTSSPGLITFDMTTIVQEWFAGYAYYGVALKYESGTSSPVYIKSWNSGNTTCSYYEITYNITPAWFDNGTYLIVNRKHNMCAQLDNVNNQNEDIKLELWDFDFEWDQLWDIEYLHNGYYKVISKESGKALTSPNSNNNANIIQQAYTASANQQWRITSSGNGYYVFRPRSNVDTLCMASNNILIFDDLANGRNIQQTAYTADDSYNDEWKIVSVSADQIVSITATQFGELYNQDANITLHYQTNTDLDVFTTITTDKQRIIYNMTHSKIFTLAAHGTENLSEIKLTDTEYLYMSDISSLPDSEFENLEVAVLSVCYAGKEGHLADILHDKGVDVVIAFKTKVNADLCMYWVRQLHYYFSVGNTIENSISFANIDTTSYYTDIFVPKYSESYPELDLENSDVELQKIINASNQRILKVQDNLIPCPN